MKGAINVYKVKITRRTSFEACHHLNNYLGKCARVHGHSYKLEVTVSGLIDNCPMDYEPADNQMVLDFNELDRIIESKVTKVFDHEDLNKFFPQPTAECMVIHIYELISQALPVDCTLENVRLWETENSYAEYGGEIVE